MKSVVYLTCTSLPCITVTAAPIVLCLSPELETESGNPTIPGTLTAAEKILNDCGDKEYWRYTISYDETLFVDPDTTLVAENILAIFCETCFTDWIQTLIAAAGEFPSATKVTGGAPYTNDGYVSVVINGTTIKLMTTA